MDLDYWSEYNLRLLYDANMVLILYNKHEKYIQHKIVCILSYVSCIAIMLISISIADIQKSIVQINSYVSFKRGEIVKSRETRRKAISAWWALFVLVIVSCLSHVLANFRVVLYIVVCLEGHLLDLGHAGQSRTELGQNLGV